MSFDLSVLIGQYVIPQEGNPACLASGNWRCVGHDGKKLLLEDSNGIEYKIDPKFVKLSHRSYMEAIDNLRKALDEVERYIAAWKKCNEAMMNCGE